MLAVIVTTPMMTVDALDDFILRRMRMSHVYQPLLIRSLVNSGGLATVRQLALELLQSDESQILYYEDRIRRMPLPVLRKHGIVSSEGGVVRLNQSRLTFDQRNRLRNSCDVRIGLFLSSRGISTWDYRLLELDPVPESLRYEVLKRDRSCVLCGARPPDCRLEVDHIRPRSKGGTNDLTNLQALCDRCNRGKSNRDDTDLRPEPASAGQTPSA